MVCNFCDSTDGAAGGADGVALAKGDGGGDSLDAANARAVHTLEELSGVGAEGFRVTALAFGVEGIESKGGLARAGGTGQDMKHTEGKIEGEIFQIILAGTFDADKTGWIHGVGRLALSGARTNERVGVCEKKFITKLCNIG